MNRKATPPPNPLPEAERGSKTRPRRRVSLLAAPPAPPLRVRPCGCRTRCPVGVGGRGRFLTFSARTGAVPWGSLAGGRVLGHLLARAAAPDRAHPPGPSLI